MFGPRRWIALAAALAVLAISAIVVVAKRGPRPPQNVIFVVLDTVRSQSTSLCGYDRPTTPVLDGLAALGTHTCTAVTPGTWTVPSHASFFTGRDLVQLRSGDVEPAVDETLAGQLAARGYTTVMLSGNMVLKKPDYLGLGFQHRRIAGDYNELDGQALADALRELLLEVDPDAPLFLFVNIADAHAPYPAVPPGVDWLPPQKAVHHRMWSGDPDTPFNRYVSGRMTPVEAERHAGRMRNGYDWGVHQADISLAGVLAVLRDAGRLGDYRMVVTSDHGEFVGEHGQLGHGDTLFEPGVRVPFLFVDSRGRDGVLPDPFPAQHAFELARDGALPTQLAPTMSITHYRESQRQSFDGLALWSGTEKLLWRQGDWEQLALEEDPDEAHPQPLGAHSLRPDLEAMVDAHIEVLESRREPDHETMELLRAAGYVE